MQDLQLAYILHRRAYGNTSLLLELFTEQQGRVSALIRSARGPQSRYRGQLDLFIPMQLAWRGRQELKYVTQLDVMPHYHELTGNGLFCGFYLNELLIRLLQKEDPHRELFSLYQKTLKQLSLNKNLTTNLRLFEKSLLQRIGYGLSLNRTLYDNQPIQATCYYQYKHEGGFIYCDNPALNHEKFLGAHLLALDQNTLTTDAAQQDAKRLLRLVLKNYLGDRPIKSRAMW